MSEITRRSNSREQVLAVLQAKRIVTNVELNAICYRFGARLKELRDQGYDIVTGEKKGGVVTYHFKGWKQSRQQELFA
jgi:hypothetical protein